MGWISVKDQLPHDEYKKYSVKKINGDVIKCFFMPDKISWIAFYGQKTSYWMKEKSGELIHDVTHWMPISKTNEKELEIWETKEEMEKRFKKESDVVLPEKNEFKFNGTLEEFKKYLPEMYEKMHMKRAMEIDEIIRRFEDNYSNINNEIEDEISALAITLYDILEYLKIRQNSPSEQKTGELDGLSN